MSAVDWLSIAAGIVVLTLLGSDVFTTVLHPWGRSGRLGRGVTHGVWRTALRLTRNLSAPRRHWLLGLVGPVLIPVIVSLWATLAVLGFAFLYLPGMPESFQRWEPFSPPDSFSDAFYFSGYTFFTLGYGDIVPTTAGLRLLAIVQTGGGFALITLVISYFFSVYDAYTHKKVLAESVFYQAGRSAEAAHIIARQVADGIPLSILVHEVTRLRDGLVRLRSQYSDYPILHFFRARLPEQSFVRLLFVSQDLSLLLDTTIDPEERPDVAGIGTRTGLADAVDAAQNSLVRALLQQVPQEVRDGASHSKEREEAWIERFIGARQILAEAGIPVRTGGDAVRDYCERRSEWEPLLRACTEALGHEWEEVTGEK